MYICEVHAQCDARFSEIMPENMNMVECMVEESVGQALMDLFGVGTVDDVSIYVAPYLKLKYYFIQVRAQCAYEDFILRPCTEEHVKEAIGRKVRAVLRELFLSAEVDAITLMPAPWDEGESAPRYRIA